MLKRVIFIPLLTFNPIRIADRDWMTERLKQSSRGALEYNFTSLFMWRHAYALQAADYKGRLIVASNPDNPKYLFPDGPGPIEPYVEALYEDAKARGARLAFWVLLDEHKEQLERAYPGKFDILEDRDQADYLYTAESLITLRGKKLSAKRNHINRFMSTFRNFSYEPITKDNIREVLEMDQLWCEENCGYQTESLTKEENAVDQVLHNYFDLHVTGGLLRVNDKVVAFTLGEPLNGNTYLMHIEKALDAYPGAYQMINQMFAEANFEGFAYVNREDDAGDEGLRRAKLSYDPVQLVTKYFGQLKGDSL